MHLYNGEVLLEARSLSDRQQGSQANHVVVHAGLEHFKRADRCQSREGSAQATGKRLQSGKLSVQSGHARAGMLRDTA